MPYVFHLQVLGTHGAIRGPRLYSENLQADQIFMDVPGVYPDSPDVSHHPFDQEIDYFVDCIIADQEPMIGIPDAFKTHEIAFAAERSAETGKPVTLPYPETNLSFYGPRYTADSTGGEGTETGAFFVADIRAAKLSSLFFSLDKYLPPAVH